MRIALGLVASSSLLGCTSNSTPLSNRETAVAALQAVFGDKDTSALDDYFDPAFVRHDPAATADGTAAFKAQWSGALKHISFTSFRAYQHDDLVVVHDEYDDDAAGTRTIGDANSPTSIASCTCPSNSASTRSIARRSVGFCVVEPR